jgi:acetylornithine deacetylase/succinyl-diaminopimelate desuccinylase-like protein
VKRRNAIAAILAILIAAALALHFSNRNLTQQIEHGLYVPKKSTITPEIGLLQQYVRIDTTNPPGNEIAGAKFLGALLDQAHVPYEIIESAPRRANLYARIRGKNRGDGLLLHNHIDVVPALGKWDVPPFSGAIKINMLHGRGAIDMKSIAICELEAFLDVARSGKVPEHDLVFLATADEETGSFLGTRWLLEHRPDVFSDIKYMITEGGVTEMQKEKVTYFGVETGSKQIVAFDLIGKDEASLQRARIGLEPYFRAPDPDRLLPGIRRFFHAVAPQRLDFREPLENIDKTIADGHSWLLPSTMRELLQNTIWARSIERRPDGTFAMHVLMSNLPDEDPDQRLKWVLEKVKSFGVTPGAIVRKEGPAPISSDETPLFAIIARDVRRELGDVPVGPEVLATTTNDARFLRPKGFICYGLQPFPLDFFQSISVHHTNERVRIDWFMSGVRVMKRIVSDWAFESTS